MRPDPADPALWAEIRTVAVLGASIDHWRPAFYVPHHLYSAGMRILPVNPRLDGTAIWGRPVVDGLYAIRERVDLIDVFRRAEALPGHVDEILALADRQRARGEPPPLVWLQSGIRHAEVVARLRAAGLPVVEDACAMVEHGRAGAVGAG